MAVGISCRSSCVCNLGLLAMGFVVWRVTGTIPWKFWSCVDQTVVWESLPWIMTYAVMARMLIRTAKEGSDPAADGFVLQLPSAEGCDAGGDEE